MILDSHKLAAASGEPGDRVQFTEYIQKNVALYQFRNGIPLTTAAAANFHSRRLELAAIGDYDIALSCPEMCYDAVAYFVFYLLLTRIGCNLFARLTAQLIEIGSSGVEPRNFEFTTAMPGVQCTFWSFRLCIDLLLLFLTVAFVFFPQNPYSVNILLAGYDNETGPSLYYIDYIATLHKVDKGAFGYGSYFFLSMMDRHYHSNMTVEEAIDLVDKCIMEIRSRLVVAPPNFVIKIVDKDGAREYAWRESVKDAAVPSA
ncbi:Proteasome subunit beta type-2-B [Hibiscus syriacus]|uniref:Proteasome subunit beta type-2-B n=1 Tax=Hibiscus syriacus TaxID=106335 RepID=A0A6A3BP65_HIBSY|nr:Proteasome subunit beta type-2-B [Hibiscus syriacus]